MNQNYIWRHLENLSRYVHITLSIYTKTHKEMFINHEKDIMQLILQNTLLRHTKQSRPGLGPYTKTNCACYLKLNLFLANARVLILNMTKLFLNCLPKKYTNKVFLLPTLDFFFACNFIIFFSNMTIIF